MNCTARIETTGAPDKIHVSKDTAMLLESAGKGFWIKKREELVHAKGKGQLETYWLEIKAPRTGSVKSGASRSSVTSSISDSDGAAKRATAGLSDAITKNLKGSLMNAMNARQQRLIDWNVDIILRILREIIARREAIGSVSEGTKTEGMPELDQLEKASAAAGKMVLDEVVEVVELETFNAKAFSSQKDYTSIELSDKIIDQARKYIGASKYDILIESWNVFNRCFLITVLLVCSCCVVS